MAVQPPNAPDPGIARAFGRLEGLVEANHLDIRRGIDDIKNEVQGIGARLAAVEREQAELRGAMKLAPYVASFLAFVIATAITLGGWYFG